MHYTFHSISFLDSSNFARTSKRIRSDQECYNRIRKAHPIRRPQASQQRRIADRVLHRRANFLYINVHIVRYDGCLHSRGNSQPNRSPYLSYCVDKSAANCLIGLRQTVRREECEGRPDRVGAEDR